MSRPSFLNDSASNNEAKLSQLAQSLRSTPVQRLFSFESSRLECLRLSLEDRLFVDFSRHPASLDLIKLLALYGEERGVLEAREAMRSGKALNFSENRAVMHVALRSPKEGPRYKALDKEISSLVHDVLDKMYAFMRHIYSGKHLGATGKKLRWIVNIGIGGSDLGPQMVCQALRPYWQEGIKPLFLSNVDPAAAKIILEKIAPEEVLFIVASKTFTTQETLANAKLCRDWLRDKLNRRDVRAHFAAVSSNTEACIAFGIRREAIFGFWDWVGGRTSLWSSVGLSILLTIGKERWQELLAGAHSLDQHFFAQAFNKNIPYLMAGLGFWYRRFWNISSHAVLPYDQHLARLPAYLQQLDMESNGKSVDQKGRAIDKPTGQVLWGEPGTNAQHSFYQLLHQGSDRVSCDLLFAACAHEDMNNQHSLLLANAIAQGRVFMEGQSYEDALKRAYLKGMSGEVAERFARASVMMGMRPVTSFVYKKLTPWVLGAILAAYEHKVFCQGVLYGVNSFDQMGVELGKVLAQEILQDIDQENLSKGYDPSTRALIELINELRCKED